MVANILSAARRLLLVLTVSVSVLGFVGVFENQPLVGAQRHLGRLRMIPSNISPPAQPPEERMSSSSSVSAVWVTLHSEGRERIFSIKCDRAITTVDDLKDLIKQKCSSTLATIDSIDLDVKGNDGNIIRPILFLSLLSEGKSDMDAFIVQVPKISKL